MLTALRLAAPHHNEVVLPDVVCTLLYVVAVVATIVAFVGLLLSLFSGAATGPRTGWQGAPIFTNWLYAAGVALIAWLLLLFLC